MNHRLALLSAILANPDDDLPRLVFADWLEENGTTDADTARVEFIRLGCKSKAKSRMTTAEGKWMDANWRRLLGGILSATTSLGATEPAMIRQGRHFMLLFERIACDVVFEYTRGFARRIGYSAGRCYRWFWQAAATDEPLAYHRPNAISQVEGNRMIGWWSVLSPQRWSEQVFARAPGGRLDFDQGVKLYFPQPPEASFHPYAVGDELDAEHPSGRQWAAVATAMTAIAREYVGLAPAASGAT
jgi:uncharacterized protein (TIGR02996 family)